MLPESITALKAAITDLEIGIFQISTVIFHISTVNVSECGRFAGAVKGMWEVS